MRDQAEIARRLESVVGDALVDYFTVYLPVQLLMVDIIGLERRSVPAPMEFCLRAVEAGLGEGDDILGFLGLDADYGERLLAGMRDGDYLGKDGFGKYQLMRRGKELLKQGGEASPADRRMQVLWDPIQRVILDRTLVYTKQRTDPDGIIAPIPSAFTQPSPDELEVGEINKLRSGNAGGFESGASTFDVLRVTGVHKSFGRYRPCLALVFSNADGDLTLRLAINGSIDNELTATCAKIGLPKLIGVDRKIGLRPGVQAVRKRREDLQCGDSGSKNVAQLVKRRSMLRFKLQTFEKRLSEEYVESLDAKMVECQKELNDVSSQLEHLPVIPVRCHEVDYYLAEALKGANSTITISTTNPSTIKVDGEILGHLRSCLMKGVRVTICISDRFGDNDATLATLDKLARNGKLAVQFLQNDQRSVFEIEWDGKYLLFSNEPPLGNRRRPISPREFAGYFVSDEQAVSHYRSNFLAFRPDDFLVRLRPVVGNNTKQKQRRRSHAGESVRRVLTK
ncbi:hypothetical protein [Burkholderia cepacia]|uniref:hypothetical protein n=1 Tax=Burkholderia cepacia TaxID=292 RepID=UPI00264BC4ED|nr:hypothetical protein [Burkholderia cepacia]MDN7914442.1 hypothetical protein [Burkholderia cepacia]